MHPIRTVTDLSTLSTICHDIPWWLGSIMGERYLHPPQRKKGSGGPVRSRVGVKTSYKRVYLRSRAGNLVLQRKSSLI